MGSLILVFVAMVQLDGVYHGCGGNLFKRLELLFERLTVIKERIDPWGVPPDMVGTHAPEADGWETIHH
jgi:hypothetical protein